MKLAGINTEFGVQINGTRYWPGAKGVFPSGRFIVHTQPVSGGSPDDLEVSLIIRNTGSEPLQLDEIILFHTEDSLLGDVPSSNWYIYRQGRHKQRRHHQQPRCLTERTDADDHQHQRHERNQRQKIDNHDIGDAAKRLHHRIIQIKQLIH